MSHAPQYEVPILNPVAAFSLIFSVQVQYPRRFLDDLTLPMKIISFSFPLAVFQNFQTPSTSTR